MKSYLHALRLLSLAALSLTAFQPAYAQHYTATDLGKDNAPWALNNSGQVVGSSPSGPFLWTPGGGNVGGGTVTLLVPCTASNRAASINSSGQIVGGYTTQNGTNYGFHHGFLWTPTAPNAATGTLVDLDTLLPAGSGWHIEYGASINDAGLIVGSGAYTDPVSGLTTQTNLGFQRDPITGVVTVTRLGMTRFTYAINDGPLWPTAINNQAYPQVPGNDGAGGNGEGGQACFWQNGAETLLGSTGASTTLNRSMCVNTQGQMVGCNNTHAFLWTPDASNGATSSLGMQQIDPVGTYVSYGVSINDAGQVVGHYNPAINTNSVCFLWDTVNGWRDVKTLTTLPSNWSMGNRCYAINNRAVNGVPAAQIINSGGSILVTTTTIVHNKKTTTTTAETHGFLLTPQ